ncbi:TPA: hypothetical protein PTW22_003613, partial [Clostridium botulinum]|nr:hypothetical protein [Clostridium botulinum]
MNSEEEAYMKQTKTKYGKMKQIV